MRADLHMHSIYSDGLLPPLELARIASETGLGLFSITDHDTLDGQADKRLSAEAYGIAYLRGWEISTYDGAKVHILGYNCKRGEEYADFVEKRRLEAYVRTKEMLEKANMLFHLAVTTNDVRAERVRDHSVMHPIYAVRAVAKKLGCDPAILNRELFSKGKPAYCEPHRPLPEEAIDIIHACGGVAVLAHPGRIRLSEERKHILMERLTDHGLDGLECLYPTHTPEETEYYLSYAHERGLYVTGGSDFHSEDGKHVIGQPVYEADENFLARVFPGINGV